VISDDKLKINSSMEIKIEKKGEKRARRTILKINRKSMQQIVGLLGPGFPSSPDEMTYEYERLNEEKIEMFDIVQFVSYIFHSPYIKQKEWVQKCFDMITKRSGEFNGSLGEFIPALCVPIGTSSAFDQKDEKNTLIYALLTLYLNDAELHHTILTVLTSVAESASKRDRDELLPQALSFVFELLYLYPKNKEIILSGFALLTAFTNTAKGVSSLCEFQHSVNNILTNSNSNNVNDEKKSILDKTDINLTTNDKSSIPPCPQGFQFIIDKMTIHPGLIESGAGIFCNILFSQDTWVRTLKTTILESLIKSSNSFNAARLKTYFNE